MKTLKFKFIAVAFASFVLTANSVSAQAIQAAYSVKSEDPFTVKYLGDEGNYLLFEVVVKSAEVKTGSLDITDKTEGELYADNFRTNFKVKKLKIEKRANQQLNFKLEFGRQVYNKSFSVKTNVVESTVVLEDVASL